MSCFCFSKKPCLLTLPTEQWRFHCLFGPAINLDPLRNDLTMLLEAFWKLSWVDFFADVVICWCKEALKKKNHWKLIACLQGCKMQLQQEVMFPNNTTNSLKDSSPVKAQNICQRAIRQVYFTLPFCIRE